MAKILSSDQLAFIENKLQVSLSQRWVEELTQLKNVTIKKEASEEEIDSAIALWELVAINTAPGSEKPYKCLCGRSLKNQYIVENKQYDITYSLGSECIKKYVGIDGSVAKRVLKGKTALDAMIDEILEKFQTDAIEKQRYLLDYKYLTKNIRDQLELGLPLATTQLETALKNLNYAYLKKDKNIRKAYGNVQSLEKEELAYFNSVSPEARKALIVKLINGQKITTQQQLKATDLSNIALREKAADLSSITLGEKVTDLGSITLGEKAIDSSNIVLDKKANVSEASLTLAKSLLNAKQYQFWATKMSVSQRKETAEYIIEKKNILAIKDVKMELLDKNLIEQITLGLPVTEKQKAAIHLKDR